jgi:exosortase/archaeosortase family protein
MGNKQKKETQRRWARRVSRDKRKPTKETKPGYFSRPHPRIERIVAFFRRNWTATKVCFLFAVFILIFLLIYSKWLTDSAQLDGLERITAHITSSIINFFGGNTIVEGKVVRSDRFSFEIIESCTGIIPMMIYVAAVLAYPSTVKPMKMGIFNKIILLRPLGALLELVIAIFLDCWKWLGIIIGILILYTVNIIRMVTLFYIGTYFHSFFNVAHYLIWQALMILVAIALWLLWTMRLTRATQK